VRCYQPVPTHTWAHLVLLDASFPLTQASSSGVTFIVFGLLLGDIAECGDDYTEGREGPTQSDI
jgi:hypothetical protein